MRWGSHLEDGQRHAVRWEAGLEYHAALRRWNRRAGFWYVHSSFGAIRHGIDARATLRYVPTGETRTVTTGTTDSRFAMTYGGGLIYRVRPRLGFVFAGDLDFVWTKVYYTNGTSGYSVRGVVPGIRAGLAFLP